MIIGERIKQRRIELGLTQTELAKRMGYVSKTTICKVERGEDNITLDRVSKFAKALECNESYIMGWDESSEVYNENEIVHELYDDSDEQTKEMVKRILGYYEKLNRK